MIGRILAAALMALLLAAPALAQQPQSEAQAQAQSRSGGCASGFCGLSNAQKEGASGDIDQVEAEMKRQLSGQGGARPQARQGMMGGMSMCPFMRMMAQMMQGGAMNDMHMNIMRGGQQGMLGMDMPGMKMPPDAPKPDAPKPPAN